MTTVAVLQPTYLPWLGYFDIIDQADTVILWDTAQFSRQSWHHRNRILTPQGVQWLTIPIRHRQGAQAIRDTFIDNHQPWRRKHNRTIQQTYGTSPVLDRVRHIITSPYVTIGELTTRVIRQLVHELGITTTLTTAQHATLPELLRHAEADLFLEPAGGHELHGIDIEGIPVRYHQYEPHPYQQNTGGGFVPYLSVIDALGRHGPQQTLTIIRNGRK